jgi:hypothetical protein
MGILLDIGLESPGVSWKHLESSSVFISTSGVFISLTNGAICT